MAEGQCLPDFNTYPEFVYKDIPVKTQLFDTWLPVFKDLRDKARKLQQTLEQGLFIKYQHILC